MRRIAAVVTLCILMLSLAACGRSSKLEAANDKNSTQQSETVSNLTTENKTTGQITQKPSEQTSSNVGVVAKSNNAVSSEDKEAVMEDLDKELDSLFSSINNLEDVQDSDLELN